MSGRTHPTKSFPSAQFPAVQTILISLILLVLAGCTAGPIGPQSGNLDGAIKQQIMASTVHLEFIGSPEPNQEMAIAAQSLGTLVQIDGRQFILTHNHWPMSVIAVETLIIRDAHGRQLLVLDRQSYLSRVCFRDKGTLLLSIPGSFKGLPAAELADPAYIQPNAAVWVVSRRTNSEWELDVIPAQMLADNPSTGSGTISLNGPVSAVSQGDSGGGIWHEGRLIGNLWAIFVTPQLNLVRQDSDHSGLIDYQPNGDLLAATLPDFHPSNQSSPGQGSGTCESTTVPSGLIP